MTFALFPLRVYYTVLFLLFAALLITFFQRAEYYDEAWFAEQSFWLIREGKVRSELFRGYNGWENGIYVFHKLFVYAGALVMSVTGITVATSKLVSIFFGLTGACLVWLYGREISAEQRWLSVILYIGCGSLIRFIAVNRPEAMCMTLGFASYLALDPPGTSRSRPMLAGLLAGLAALTHLNGLIYLMAGAGWLFVKMGWRLTLLFAIAGTITLSLYGLDALLDGNLAMLIEQFRHDPATQGNLNVGGKLSVMADYHRIFFHSQNEGALSVVVLLCAFAFRKYFNLSQPVLLYTLLLFVSFWLLTKSATNIYFMLFVPFLAVLAASWLSTYLPRQPAWQKRAGQVLLILYCIVSFISMHIVLIENETTPDIEAHNALLATYMPHQHSNVIAPIEFFFGQMDNYKIRGLTYYYLIQREGKELPLSTFFQLAQKDNVAYIISDHRLNSSYDIPMNAPAQIGVYRRIFQDSLSTIYAR